MRIRLIAPALAIASGLCLAPSASAQDYHFSITPYVWLPNINGTLRFNIPPGATGSPEVETGPNDYLENLQSALMLAGEVRINSASVFTDIIYLDFSNEDGKVRSVNGPGPIGLPIDVGTRYNFQGTLWTLGGGLSFIDNENLDLQGFAGFRYMGADSEVNWKISSPVAGLPVSGTTKRESDLWDGLVGIRGEGRWGGWFAPYYLDVGAGSSTLTWQAMAGVGYRWGWGDLRLTYRHLSYDQDEDSMLKDIRFDGPAFGAQFRF